MIQTARLQLIPCEERHFEAFLQNREKLATLLQVNIPADWPQFPEAMPYSYKYLKADPSSLGWWTYLFIHPAHNALIGSGGFKGKADDQGRVEIGYEIASEYQNQGLATEAVRGFVEYAFSNPLVNSVEAHTLAEPNASTKVLQKAGFQYAGTVHDPEDGDIWQWRLTKEQP